VARRRGGRRIDSLWLRFALASLVSAVLALVVVGVGVLWFGGMVFEGLMVAGGASVADSRDMFSQSVTRTLLIASGVALVVSLAAAALLGRLVSRPLALIAAAARGIGQGRYGAGVPRPATPELASLADSFNQMSRSLEDQERLRRELIANFAHELRTPLTNLQGYLQALRDGVMVPSPELFASLDEEVGRLNRLSRSLDVLAAGEPRLPTEQVEVDLVRVVDAAYQLCRPRFDARRVRVTRYLPGRLAVDANPDQLAQVVLNLLQNAARYTPEGGSVSITARLEAGNVLVTVTNTGEDIPPGDLPFVFERFYRVDKSRDPARGGAGIGLAIVKQLVEAAGGRVGVESSNGLIRFWFTLPSV
jgi:signal transduction histidine kinase